MTIFDDVDVDDCPFLHRWTITIGPLGYPMLSGQHAFHDGVRTAIDEVYVVDPLLRWAIGSHGGFRLVGANRAAEVGAFGRPKRDDG